MFFIFPPTILITLVLLLYFIHKSKTETRIQNLTEDLLRINEEKNNLEMKYNKILNDFKKQEDLKKSKDLDEIQLLFTKVNVIDDKLTVVNANLKAKLDIIISLLENNSDEANPMFETPNVDIRENESDENENFENNQEENIDTDENNILYDDKNDNNTDIYTEEDVENNENEDLSNNILEENDNEINDNTNSRNPLSDNNQEENLDEEDDIQQNEVEEDNFLNNDNQETTNNYLENDENSENNENSEDLETDEENIANYSHSIDDKIRPFDNEEELDLSILNNQLISENMENPMSDKYQENISIEDANLTSALSELNNIVLDLNDDESDIENNDSNNTETEEEEIIDDIDLPEMENMIEAVDMQNNEEEYNNDINLNSKPLMDGETESVNEKGFDIRESIDKLKAQLDENKDNKNS